MKAVNFIIRLVLDNSIKVLTELANLDIYALMEFHMDYFSKFLLNEVLARTAKLTKHCTSTHSV